MESLEYKLSESLKCGFKYTLFNSFNTKKSVPVIHKPRSEKSKLCLKTKHFCVLFRNDEVQHRKVPLLGIEIYVYHTFYDNRVEKLVYVGKADTTGLNGSIDINVGKFVSEYINWCAGLKLEETAKLLVIKKDNRNKKTHKIHGKFVSTTHRGLHILARRAGGDSTYGKDADGDDIITVFEYLKSHNININSDVITKLVMFTRSENQYLFPESVKNDKHILNDRKLLEWWLKNVEKLCSCWEQVNGKYLNILNSEDREIRRFLPSGGDGWKIGNVYGNDPSLIAIHQIPLLPDDPKGRFLEHLVVEGRAKRVKCPQYWQELGIRQEFSFGAIVGLIGVEGVPSLSQSGTGNHISARSMHKFTELVNTKDYSDETDWADLHDLLSGMNSLKETVITGCGTSKKTHQLSTQRDISAPTVNTLLCVRKKRKI